jgi:16S rRNA (cytosine1402-N4)-methyltransferase
MATSVLLESPVLRRVLRMRSLIAGPLAMERTTKHEPVMLEEILEALDLQPGGVVVDGTLGLGGHSEAFLGKVSPGGTLVGMDWDSSMLDRAEQRLNAAAEGKDVRLVFEHNDFRSCLPLLLKLGLTADGCLLDLGLNSAQVDDPERGMSFRDNGPLDMRMDRSRGESAASLLNRMSLGEIEQMLWDLGDERWARMIARRIVERRKALPLKTTQDLVDCVMAAIPAGARDKRIHPATRTFQAVRIHVNGELDGLEDAIREIASVLSPSGTIAILSYHSGEDRIVKTTFRDLAESQEYKEIYRKPLTASENEIRMNPRARSAKLRVLRRTGNGMSE